MLVCSHPFFLLSGMPLLLPCSSVFLVRSLPVKESKASSNRLIGHLFRPPHLVAHRVGDCVVCVPAHRSMAAYCCYGYLSPGAPPAPPDGPACAPSALAVAHCLLARPCSRLAGSYSPLVAPPALPVTSRSGLVVPPVPLSVGLSVLPLSWPHFSRLCNPSPKQLR